MSIDALRGGRVVDAVENREADVATADGEIVAVGNGIGDADGLDDIGRVGEELTASAFQTALSNPRFLIRAAARIRR